MRHARFVRGGLGVFLAGCSLVPAGCTHNYYYGAAPPCGTATIVPGTAANGAVCEVPSQVSGGSLVAQLPARSTIVSGAPLSSGTRPQRVVVSEPGSGSRLRWRRADPESSLATTRVDGALDDSTTTR